MIPFEIEYVRPTTAEGAVAAHREATDAGLTARYLGGGTELVTMARDGRLEYDVLIDLKRIPESTDLDPKNLTYGACLRLSELSDGAAVDGATELVGRTAGGVADRTTRNSITLGGNICGMLPYREALLPFLLLDAECTVVGHEGRRRVPIAELYDKRMKLGAGEFLLSLHLGERAKAMAVHYRRRTRGPRVDYPLVTLCMARDDAGVRMAIGGAFGPPIRSAAAEQILNGAAAGASREAGDTAALTALAVAAIGQVPRTDLRGSAEYREALLGQCVREGLEALGGKR